MNDPLADDTAMLDDTLPLRPTRAPWADDLGWPPGGTWMTLLHVQGVILIAPRWTRRGGECCDV